MESSDSEGSITENQFWELALAVNAAFKGLLGSLGQSGHICTRTKFIEQIIDTEQGWEAVCQVLSNLLLGQLNDGDVVVVPDKVVAASQGRIAPRRIILDPDPKTVASQELKLMASKYEKELGFPVTPLHLLLGDEYPNNQATLGTLDHNVAAWELANRIFLTSNCIVDVIISDTDTGLDIREPLIGCVTIAATPLGATGGVNLYEAMRCAVAAEFVRGHDKKIPIVICIPAERRRKRENVGVRRSYNGALHISKEPSVTYI